MKARTRDCLLVCAGEPSGDAMAASVVARLAAPSFGVGGVALERAGLETVVDSRPLAVMGFGSVLGRLGTITGAAFRLVLEARRRRPGAALLVGYSEFNARLGRVLRRFGTRVLWYAPPQVWAWRSRRAANLTGSSDAMAVVLPFEAEWWRGFGARAEFVGHPALESIVASPRSERREELTRVLLLPGSRSQEVRAHWPLMLQAMHNLAARVRASVVIAPALARRDREWIAHAAVAHGIGISAGPVAAALTDCDVALAASGTVTVECAAAGVPPVIIYRTDALTHAVARRLVRVPSIGLPNLVLGERTFPELVQDDAEPGRITKALFAVMAERQRYVRACETVRARLRHSDAPASVLVAQMLAPWLA